MHTITVGSSSNVDALTGYETYALSNALGIVEVSVTFPNGGIKRITSDVLEGYAKVTIKLSLCETLNTLDISFATDSGFYKYVSKDISKVLKQQQHDHHHLALYHGAPDETPSSKRKNAGSGAATASTSSSSSSSSIGAGGGGGRGGTGTTTSTTSSSSTSTANQSQRQQAAPNDTRRPPHHHHHHHQQQQQPYFRHTPTGNVDIDRKITTLINVLNGIFGLRYTAEGLIASRAQLLKELKETTAEDELHLLQSVSTDETTDHRVHRDYTDNELNAVKKKIVKTSRSLRDRAGAIEIRLSAWVPEEQQQQQQQAHHAAHATNDDDDEDDDDDDDPSDHHHHHHYHHSSGAGSTATHGSHADIDVNPTTGPKDTSQAELDGRYVRVGPLVYRSVSYAHAEVEDAAVHFQRLLSSTKTLKKRLTELKALVQSSRSNTSMINTFPTEVQQQISALAKQADAALNSFHVEIFE